MNLINEKDPFHDPGVNDGWGDRGACAAFEGLLKSNGWKEVLYLLTAFGKPAYPYLAPFY